jgi:pimeloyl-ACP methyl ester carboxylesterase
MRSDCWVLTSLVVGLLACAEKEPTVHDSSPDDTTVPTVDADTPAAPDAAAPEPSEPLTSITVGDHVFQARVAGPDNGERVLLLHGFPQTSLQWRAQIAALADAGYRVVAPDQRGYSPGARPADVASYRALLLAQDVLGMADALHWTRFHLVGHDWGAGVAWIVAAIAPLRLLSLTPISVPHPDAFAKRRAEPGSCQATASSYMEDLIASDAEARLLAEDAAWLRTTYQDLPDATATMYRTLFSDLALLTPALNWYRANFGPDAVRAMLGPVRVPTLYVWSDGDVAICRDTAELSRDHVDAPYRFEVIEGVSHWVPDLAGERLTELLLEHLRMHPAR